MDKKICQMVTDRITAELEKGVIPWQRPWNNCGTGKGPCAISHVTGRRYSLLNQMILMKPGEYITYKQAQAEGGKVKKGEKGHPVVFWKQITIEEENKDGKKVKKTIPYLRYYTVFHIDQCEGIEPKYLDHPNGEIAHPDPIGEAEAIVSEYEAREALKITRDQQSNKAFYAPYGDYICVPAIEQYKAAEEYYSTLFHEMVHSTGHKSRLNRFTGKAAAAAFGSEEYSKEELVAEIGAATLVNSCGIETAKSFRNSVAYIQSWLKALKNDPTMIISAAGKAEKAVEYIIGETANDTPDPDNGGDKPINTIEAVSTEDSTDSKQETAPVAAPAAEVVERAEPVKPMKGFKKHGFYTLKMDEPGKTRLEFQSGYTDGVYNYYRPAGKKYWWAIDPDSGVGVVQDASRNIAKERAHNMAAEVAKCKATMQYKGWKQRFKELLAALNTTGIVQA